MGRVRIPRPRRIPPKPKKTIVDRMKKVLQRTGAVATGAAGYGVAEGIDAIMNGAPQNNNNNPIIVQMAAPEQATTTALAIIPANVSGEISDLKVLVLALMIFIVLVILVGLSVFGIKYREKRAVKKFQTELEKPK